MLPSTRINTEVVDNKLSPEVLISLSRVCSPNISPDSQNIVYTVKEVDLNENKTIGQIYTMSIDGNNNKKVSMPLTDSRGKALYGRARKGEKVDKEADGGGLNLQGGKIPGLSCRFAGKRKTLPLGVSPDVSLKAGRPEAMPGRLSPKAQTRRTEKGAQRGRAAPRHGIRRRAAAFGGTIILRRRPRSRPPV